MAGVPKLCLNMIVKNESHIIEERLEDLTNKISFDYYVICDTGSTDNTKEIIKSFFEKKNIQGELHEHEWSDFGKNRTKALEAAYGKSEYLLIFDADDEIHGNIVLPDTWKFDKYNLKFGSDFVYYRPLLISNQKVWRFVGVLHEFLATDEKNITETNLNGDYYIESGKTGSRSQDPEKYIKDAKILEKAYNDNFEKDYGLACRYAFYCAQSFKDSGPEYVNYAIDWYNKVVNLNSWSQEKYYSCIMLGNLHKDNFKKLKYYLKAIEYDHQRIEGVVKACELCMNNGLHSLVCSLYDSYKGYKLPKGSKLFMFSNLYNDHLEYYYTISSFYLKKTELGYNVCKKIIENNILDDNLLEQLYKNILFFKIQLYDDSSMDLFEHVSNYIKTKDHKNEKINEGIYDLWKFLFKRHNKILTYPKKFSFINEDKPYLFLSFTTCKRIDLFKQTVYSLMNQVEDLQTINYWFCVDDNSSIEDRNEMKKLFPWIKFYDKSFEEKGHRASMNIIYDKLKQLKPTYWFHLEDDFLFFKKINLRNMINRFEALDNKNVKQLLFNRNYAETIVDYKIKGAESSNIENIVVHNYKTGVFPYCNCHYWPNYSFRPSITKVEAILELGNYNSDNHFFEMDYARKYTEKGYVSAFLNEITNIHIGKLTSETNAEKQNAYALNQEEQFEKKSPYIKIINLERRKDRKEKMEELFKNEHISNWVMMKAVDGNRLEPDIQVASLFYGNDFCNRKAVIGCALSHYELWQMLLEDKTNEYYVIFEDDVELDKQFYERFYSLQQDMAEKDFLFLGYHMYNKHRDSVKHKYRNNNTKIEVEKLNTDLYIGGYFCYSINKTGAKKMLDYIEEFGIKHGIDYMNIVNENIDSYECVPQLVFSEWNENGKKIDSDIQNIYDSFELENFSYENEDDENFVYIDGYDQLAYDICYNKDIITRQKNKCLKDEKIAGFNSLGFLKSHIFSLQKSPYFKENDGIYIKRSYMRNLGYDIRNPPMNLNRICDKYEEGDFCFIHSCHVSELGLVILNRLLDTIEGYGKMESYKKIFIINIGKKIEENTYEKYKNVIVINLSNNAHLYELKTINLLYYFSLINSNSRILYIHTKGILREDNEKIQQWVNMMLYFLVKRQDSCIKYLEEYDAVGCNYIVSKDIKPHFSGNFWWANTNYIQSLDIITTTPRHDAEWWILTNPTHRFNCIHHSMVNHYDEDYPPEKYDKIRVKMMCNWCSSKSLCKEWNNMCIEENVWNNIEITWEDTDIDYYVIINYPSSNDYFDKSRTIVFQMEPWVNDETKNWGVKTWGLWANPSESEFMSVIGRQSSTYNNVFWQLKLTTNELTNLEYNKENILSCVTSNKYFDEGHIARIDFLKFLENKKDIPLKIFGNVEEMGFENYQGILEPENKAEGIVPYKYYFMVENNYEKDFITEKLWEPIMCESLVFYYGCPNVTDYIDSDAFVLLDMNDFEKSYQTIKTAIEEDWWSQRIDKIKQEKYKLLNEMAFFPRLRKVIENNG